MGVDRTEAAVIAGKLTGQIASGLGVLRDVTQT